jgi:sulfotransferase
MQRIHVISGLPRSGATLQSALLHENPRFEAGASGPVAGLLGAIPGCTEFPTFINDAQRCRMPSGVFENDDAGCDEDVIFGTRCDRGALMNVVAELFPDPRCIACVDPMQRAVGSVERQLQKNAFDPSLIVHFSANGAVYTRADGVAKGDRSVMPCNAWKQAFCGAHADRLVAGAVRDLVDEYVRRPRSTTSSASGLARRISSTSNSMPKPSISSSVHRACARRVRTSVRKQVRRCFRRCVQPIQSHALGATRA